MSAVAHTPGPLIYGDSSMDDPSPGPKWEVYTVHAGATAYCWKAADARLYAAAPDLLDAAKLLEAAEDFNANDCRECDGEGVPELCPVCFPKFDDARVAHPAAIAKAVS